MFCLPFTLAEIEEIENPIPATVTNVSTVSVIRMRESVCAFAFGNVGELGHEGFTWPLANVATFSRLPRHHPPQALV